MAVVAVLRSCNSREELYTGECPSVTRVNNIYKHTKSAVNSAVSQKTRLLYRMSTNDLYSFVNVL
jgi:hypothetical protein